MGFNRTLLQGGKNLFQREELPWQMMGNFGAWAKGSGRAMVDSIEGIKGGYLTLGTAAAAGMLAGYQGDRQNRMGRMTVGAVHGAAFGASLLRAGGGASRTQLVKALVTDPTMNRWAMGAAGGAAFSMLTGGNMGSGMLYGSALATGGFGARRAYLKGYDDFADPLMARGKAHFAKRGLTGNRLNAATAQRQSAIGSRWGSQQGQRVINWLKTFETAGATPVWNPFA
jgi:hypothetical protein